MQLRTLCNRITSAGKKPVPNTYDRIKDLGLLKQVRGSRAGVHHQRPIKTVITPNRHVYYTHSRGVNLNNLVNVTTSTSKFRLPVFFHANTQSAKKKFDDLTTTAKHHQADIICITESWFHDNMHQGAFHLEGFSEPIRNDRSDREGGGVAAWVHNDFHFKEWTELRSEDVETLWLTVWSSKMPRYYSRIIVGLIYHPERYVADHAKMTNHITQSVAHIKRQHPYCGIMILGDFNQLPDHRIKHQLHLKQIVSQATRGTATLDKLFTNMSEFYTDTIVSAPVGKSDHNVVISYPHHSLSYNKGQVRSITTRVKGPNERAMFGYHLQKVKWETLYQTDPVEEKESFFTNAIRELYELHFPSKVIKLHDKDKPWVTENYKNLIFRRQRAKQMGDMTTFRELRNQINNTTPTLKSKYYNHKIKHLKKENNRKWWRDIKPLIGIKVKDDTPMRKLAENECGGDVDQLVENINGFFKSVTDQLEPITEEHQVMQMNCHVPSEYTITISDMEKRLNKIKSNKAGGPDGLPAWIFREYSHILAAPLASIANACIRQGTHPRAWKIADTVPVPKVPVPSNIQSDLRPISLTPIPSKVVEYFPCKWIQELIKEQIDPNQYGGISESSTTLALIHLIDFLAKETDKLKTFVRLMLYDFSKAFDLVDHHIVIRKLQDIGVPDFLVKWVTSFLLQRQQRVKIGQHVSSCVTLNAGCPQGTLVGPLVFVVHINDLRFPEKILSIKYIDDTSVANSSKNPQDNTTQNSANYFGEWTVENHMKNNAKKTQKK